MVVQECELVTLLLNEYFGPVISLIADEMKWGPKPLKLLSLSVKLPLSTVSVPCFNFIFRFKLYSVHFHYLIIVGEASFGYSNPFQFRRI